MTTSAHALIWTRVFRPVFLAFVFAAGGAVGLAADNGLRTFDVPAGAAADTLKIFAKQAGREIVFAPETVGAVTTRSVRGQLAPREALEQMLLDTGLVATQDAGSGAFAVRRGELPNGPRAAQVENRSDRPAENRAGTADEVVVLSPFEVTTAADKGYRAANSVSATRVAVPIKNLPMNITALTDEFIRDQADYDLYDIVKWAGVHQDNVSQSGWVRWNLRGFTNTAVQRNGITTNFRFIDPANVERIEVVNGPASLLYGQLNPGGIINYITKRPQAKQQTLVSVSAGDHHYHRVLVDATGPVPGTGDKLLYRGVVMRENIARFSQYAEGYKVMYAPSLTWKITPRVTLTTEYEYFERNEPNTPSSLLIVYRNGLATLPYPGLPRNFSFTAIGDWQKYKSQAFTTELSVALTDSIQFRAALEQSEFRQRDRITGQAGTGILTQAAIDQFYPPGTLPPEHAMFRRNRYDLQEGDERTGQAELTGTFDVAGVRLRPLVGYRKNFHTNTRNLFMTNTTLRPWDMRNPATWDRTVPFGIEALNRNSDSSSFADNDSYYAVLTASAFDERLHLLGGFGRYNVHSAPTRNNITNTTTSPDSTRSASVPQVGALFQITPEVGAFVSYSESFLANTALLRVNSDVRTVPAKPSVGKGYEGGLKVELMNGRISGTLSYFNLEVNPTAVFEIFGGTAPDGRMLFTDVQGGSQESSGFEANLLLTPVAGLQIYANLSKIKAEYAQHPTNAAFNGTRLVGTPEESINLWAKYTIQAGPLKDFYVGGGVSRTGSFVSQASNPLVSVMPGYTTIDVTAGYTFHALGAAWTADLTLRNLTDEFYYASASSFGAPLHGDLSLSVRF